MAHAQGHFRLPLIKTMVSTMSPTEFILTSLDCALLISRVSVRYLWMPSILSFPPRNFRIYSFLLFAMYIFVIRILRIDSRAVGGTCIGTECRCRTSCGCYLALQFLAMGLATIHGSLRP